MHSIQINTEAAAAQEALLLLLLLQLLQVLQDGPCHC
jgi:hypothetical protein